MNEIIKKLVAAAIGLLKKMGEPEVDLSYLVNDDAKEVEEYQEYINAQIFEHYDDGLDLPDSNLSRKTDHDENGFPNDLENYGDTNFFDQENISIDDPRISDAQREAIEKEIRKYGVEGEINIQFDVSNAGRDEFCKFDPAAGDRIVFAVTPWGEVISSLFSQENMKMVHEVSKLEGKDIDDVILEVMAERYNLANGLE